MAESGRQRDADSRWPIRFAPRHLSERRIILTSRPADRTRPRSLSPGTPHRPASRFSPQESHADGSQKTWPLAHRRERGRRDDRDRRPGGAAQGLGGQPGPRLGAAAVCRARFRSVERLHDRRPRNSRDDAVCRGPAARPRTTTPSTATWSPSSKPTSTSSTRTRAPARSATSAHGSKAWPTRACESCANRRGASIERFQADLQRVRRRTTASTRSSSSIWLRPSRRWTTELPPRWKDLAKLLDKKKCPLPASSLYAIAALELGYPYINFTPSLGSAPAAIGELAIERGTCHMGHDGKTGETLLKSVLAPMFAARNLQVMSWVGHNIFGNLDGKVLDDPANKANQGPQQGPPAAPDSRLLAADARDASNTSKASATGRPPGTTSTSTASWARR